jgi:hypothetical protein
MRQLDTHFLRANSLELHDHLFIYLFIYLFMCHKYVLGGLLIMILRHLFLFEPLLFLVHVIILK